MSNQIIVLGSRSPRRFELLNRIISSDRIEVVPPIDDDEPGFTGLHTLSEIWRQLGEIARRKTEDVYSQIRHRTDVAAVLAADTVIVAHADSETPTVLGKPPEDDSWPDVVREWFEEYLLGRTHLAATAVCVLTQDGRSREEIEQTAITFESADRETIDWYLSTGESLGKAGGYGIQGAADLFVSRVVGSISNVVGLPLGLVMRIFRDLELLKV